MAFTDIKFDEKALALKAAGLTSPDGTFVHGPTREVIAALSATEQPRGVRVTWEMVERAYTVPPRIPNRGPGVFDRSRLRLALEAALQEAPAPATTIPTLKEMIDSHVAVGETVTLPAASISAETKTALDAIDANIRNAAVNAGTTFFGQRETVTDAQVLRACNAFYKDDALKWADEVEANMRAALEAAFLSEEAQALANFDGIADAHFASVETGLSTWEGDEALLDETIRERRAANTKRVSEAKPVAWRYRHVPSVAWSYSDTRHPRPDLEQEPLFLAALHPRKD